uniref:Uncharacterized protein n=1 Tax=Aegilops tauschii subsp. strangulata TaxID=200361 RepID=A0A452YHI6_AEGTS
MCLSYSSTARHIPNLNVVQQPPLADDHSILHVQMATKKKSIADEMGMFLQAKLRQASPSSSS